MNCIEWKYPPCSDEELQMWKVYCSTQPEGVWDKIQRWLKRFGNPFIVPELEAYDVKAERILYQLALQYVIK